MAHALPWYWDPTGIASCWKKVAAAGVSVLTRAREVWTGVYCRRTACASRAESATVYACGLVQGIVLVTFPAASMILTARASFDLSGSQYGMPAGRPSLDGAADRELAATSTLDGVGFRGRGEAERVTRRTARGWR